jgi:hypothetical protein
LTEKSTYRKLSTDLKDEKKYIDGLNLLELGAGSDPKKKKLTKVVFFPLFRQFSAS